MNVHQTQIYCTLFKPSPNWKSNIAIWYRIVKTITLTVLDQSVILEFEMGLAFVWCAIFGVIHFRQYYDIWNCWGKNIWINYHFSRSASGQRCNVIGKSRGNLNILMAACLHLLSVFLVTKQCGTEQEVKSNSSASNWKLRVGK